MRLFLFVKDEHAYANFYMILCQILRVADVTVIPISLKYEAGGIP